MISHHFVREVRVFHSLYVLYFLKYIQQQQFLLVPGTICRPRFVLYLNECHYRVSAKLFVFWLIARNAKERQIVWAIFGQEWNAFITFSVMFFEGKAYVFVTLKVHFCYFHYTGRRVLVNTSILCLWLRPLEPH